MGSAEVGMRPPASPSCRLYEPEAIGVKGAYPPACKPMAYKPTGWKRPRREVGSEKAEVGMWNVECGLRPIGAIGPTPRRERESAKLTL